MTDFFQRRHLRLHGSCRRESRFADSATGKQHTAGLRLQAQSQSQRTHVATLIADCPGCRTSLLTHVSAGDRLCFCV